MTPSGRPAPQFVWHQRKCSDWSQSQFSQTCGRHWLIEGCRQRLGQGDIRPGIIRREILRVRLLLPAASAWRCGFFWYTYLFVSLGCKGLPSAPGSAPRISRRSDPSRDDLKGNDLRSPLGLGLGVMGAADISLPPYPHTHTILLGRKLVTKHLAQQQCAETLTSELETRLER